MTEKEEQEVEYGEHVIWQLVGSKILAFGANEDGEIILTARTKDEQVVEFIISKDSDGEIALFEALPEGEQ